MYTNIIAHRGGAALWPENTMRAVDGALALRVGERRVAGVEVDVHSSRDDVTMVHHDALLDRMTDARGPLSARDAADLATVMHSDDGGAVPTLDAALASIAAHPGCIASVELKRDAEKFRYPRLSRDVVEAIDRHGLGDRAYLHAFDFAYLDELLNIAPGLVRAGNVDHEAIAAHGGFAGVLVALMNRNVRELNIDYRLADDNVIRIAHDAGFGITLWTVNSEEDLRRSVSGGVAAVATDHPDRALNVVAAYAGGPRSVPVVKSARTVSVPVTEHHMPWLARILDDAETVRFLLSKQRQLDATRYWMTQFKTQGFGMWSVFEHSDKGAGAYLGRVGFNIQRDVEGVDRPEIGWVLDRARWGQGLVPEVAEAQLKWAKDNAAFDDVIALVLPENTASIRVAEKLGMHVEKTIARFGFDEVLMYQRTL